MHEQQNINKMIEQNGTTILTGYSSLKYRIEKQVGLASKILCIIIKPLCVERCAARAALFVPT
jgi:hypothetical protein